jgi:energy-coupling factor transporter ATP-binding protein EcfA2
MQRNRSGINFDLGLPLESEWELQNLYIPVQKQLLSKLEYWLKYEGEAIFVGGQIGSGKSTLIQNLWHTSGIRPDMEFHFDREGSNLSLGDFWRIILAELIKKALDFDADLSVLRLPEELAGLGYQKWQKLLDILRPPKISLKLYSKRKSVQDKIAEMPGFIEEACSYLLKSIKTKITRNPILFASGVDKYSPDSPAFFDLRGPLKFLLSKKTLFELNVVHLFQPLFSFESDRWLLVYTMQREEIRKLLQKRMGIYFKSENKLIGTAMKWSGGNPRQAIRMLMALRNAKGGTEDEIIIKAIRNLFLEYFAYSPKPDDDLLNVVRKQNYLEPTILSLPGDKETAQRAVYGNWVLLQKKEEDGRKLRAIVNPIVLYSVRLKVKINDPEVQLLRRYLKRYAKQKHISPVGLDLNRDIISLDLWREIFKTEIEQPIATNLVEILEILKNSLLSKDRAEWMIVAYRNPEVLEAARAYLFAMANTYEHQSFKHYKIEDDKVIPPVIKLLELLEKDADILSLEFIGNKWEEKSLIEIDKMRDNLLGHQMIWWIPENSLSRNLHFWTQLRQLFRVFILEDELLASLSIEDIQSDINYFKDLVQKKKSSESNVLDNLKIVLEYLKHAKRGSSNG